jgi:hypothetical protein
MIKNPSKTGPTWRERFARSRPHKIKPACTDTAGMKAGQIMLIPSPHIVDAFIRSIPAGASMSVKSLREGLAREYCAEVTCPISTGSVLRIVAEAACEAYAEGTALLQITPFWRVLDESTPIARRLSCGTAFIRDQRRREKTPG